MKSLCSLFVLFSFMLWGSLAAQPCSQIDYEIIELDPVVCNQFRIKVTIDESANPDEIFTFGVNGVDTISLSLSDGPQIMEGPFYDTIDYSVQQAGTGGCSNNLSIRNVDIHRFPSESYGATSAAHRPKSVCNLKLGKIRLFNDAINYFTDEWYGTWLDNPQDSFPINLTIARDSLAVGEYTIRFFRPGPSLHCTFRDVTYDIEGATEGNLALQPSCENGIEPLVRVLSLETAEGDNLIGEWKNIDNGTIYLAEDIAAFSPPDSGRYEFTFSDQNDPTCLLKDTVLNDPIQLVHDNHIEITQPFCESEDLILSHRIEPDLSNSIIWFSPNGNGFFSDESATAYINQSGDHGEWRLRYGSQYCYVLDTALVVDDPQNDCGIVTGRVVLDLDDDCNADSNEPNYENVRLVATSVDNEGVVFVGFPDESGNYNITLSWGFYALSTQLSEDLFEVCEETTDVFFSSFGQDFTHLVKPLVQCERLEPIVTIPFLRRCFDNNAYVQICNNGTEASEAGQFTVELDEFLAVVESSETPVTQSGNFYIYDHPALAIGECFDLDLTVYVSCEAQLGQSHWIESSTEPEEYCPETEAVDGAFLELVGGCVGGNYEVFIENTGTEVTPGPVQYVIIEDGVMLIVPGVYNQIPPLEEGEAFQLDLPNPGSAYTVQVVQVLGAPGPEIVTEYYEGCAPEGFSVGFGNQLAQPTAYWEDKVTIANVGSYDPNDKNASPRGYGENNAIRRNDRIDYLIRFQNTGTDTAFTVVIRDTLSENLDLATISPGASSHPYRLEQGLSNELIFTFNDILLPDSSTNLLGSNGFVRFSVKPKSDIPLPFEINNEAAIYFDFNEPIITSNVYHTVDTSFLVSSTRSPLNYELAELKVFPNPVKNGTVNVELPANYSESVPYYYSFVSMMGVRVQEVRKFGRQTTVSTADLPAGAYFIVAKDQFGTVIARSRLIIQ